MKRILLLVAILSLFSCSKEEEPDNPPPQVMQYKVQVSDICDVTSQDANFTAYCISQEEFEKIQSQLRNIAPGNSGCTTITFKNQSGNTIEAYHKSSGSGINTCSL